MKYPKNFLIAFFTICFLSGFSQEKILQITVQDSLTNKTLPLAKIFSLPDYKYIGVTDSNGYLELKFVEQIDSIFTSAIGYKSRITKIVGEKKITIKLIEIGSEFELNEIVVSGFGSSKSEWIGASLIYNFGDNNEISDNIAGGAKVRLNSAIFSQSINWFDLNIIGNIGNFISSTDSLNRSSLTTIAQSEQGLIVGIEPLFTLKDKIEFTWRAWITLNYKFNDYKKTIDDKIDNIGLHQGRFTIGTEFDFIRFENNRRMHLALEGVYTIFDENKYENIFAENRKKLLSASISFILPLQGNLGLAIGETFSQGSKPTFSAGIIIAR